MKVLVTVGTTPFDRLIRELDEIAPSFQDIDFHAQISAGTYIPRNMSSISFEEGLLDNLENRYTFVITHCGAGTVFTLLEKEVPFLAVPNTDRNDKHQLDLAEYLDVENYAYVCADLKSLKPMIHKVMAGEVRRKYEKEEFFKAEEVINYLLDDRDG